MNRLANAVRAAEGVEWVTSDEHFGDSDSPSGALRLYESCGFRVDRREAVYGKPI